MTWSRRFAPDVLNLKKVRVHHLLRAMKHRNYRIFFMGEMVSLSGLWMQRVAMSWLVYRLTDSAFMLGAVDFIGQIPVFFLGMFTGVILEKMDLKKVIFICQGLSMAHAFSLAVLTLSGRVEYWHIIILSALLGVVNAFEIPARQAFVVHLVDKSEDLGNAIALNSSLFNVARLLGPSLGGLTIAAFGEGVCFVLNGLSYFATLFALMIMRLRECIGNCNGPSKNVMEGLREGLLYVRGFSPIKYTLLALVVISFAGIPYLVLLPVFAREILGGGPQTLGFLMAASGIGALVGSILLALRRSPVGLARIMGLSMSMFGISVSLFSFSRSLLLSMFLMVLVGFAMVSSMVSCNTFIQTLVDDDKRSRVMSLYIVSILGIAPLGSLNAGGVATILGAPLTLAAGGLVCVATGIVLLKQYPKMLEDALPVYRRKNLL